MKLTKRIFLLLSLVLVMALAPTALAAGQVATVDITGKTDTFVFGPGSGMSDTDLFPNFKNVMPGDTVQQRIAITHDGYGLNSLNVYMRAVPHNSSNLPGNKVLEHEGTVAEMNEFLSQLNLKIWKGTDTSKTPIYDGSPNGTGGMGGFIHLGEFRKGRTGHITAQLTVPIEMGNEFADRAGEVDWEFRVDEIESPKGDSPKTGDESNIGVFATVSVVTLVVLIAIGVVYLIRKKKH